MAGQGRKREAERVGGESREEEEGRRDGGRKTAGRSRDRVRGKTDRER